MKMMKDENKFSCCRRELRKQDKSAPPVQGLMDESNNSVFHTSGVRTINENDHTV